MAAVLGGGGAEGGGGNMKGRGGALRAKRLGGLAAEESVSE